MILHRRASAWYASHGEIEEALRHALAGQDTLGAVQMVAEHRHHLLNTEQRPRLKRRLRMSQAQILPGILTYCWPRPGLPCSAELIRVQFRSEWTKLKPLSIK